MIQNSTKTFPPSLKESLALFTECLFDPADTIEIRRLPAGKSTWHKAGALAETAESLLADNRQGQNIYAGANPRRSHGGTKNEDVVCAWCLFADFDGIGLDESRNRWQKIHLPEPTLIIASGHGVHAYWRLTDPMVDMAPWSNAQRNLIAALNSDKAIHDPARIMRLPGFMNHKPPAAMCRIAEADPTRKYPLEDLLERIGNSAQSKPIPQTQTPATTIPSLDILGRATLAAAKWPAAAEGERNTDAFHHACYLVKDFGLNDDQALSILREWNYKNSPPLSEEELLNCLKNGIAYGKHPVGIQTQGTVKPVSALPGLWDPPIPLGRFDLPIFPLEAFPGQLCVLREFCAAVAESYQVPVDLPSMLTLSMGGSALAKKILVHVRGDHREPVNLYTATALEPANRKSAVFSEVYAPLSEFEKREAERMSPLVEQNRVDRDLLEAELKHLKQEAAKKL